MLAVAAPAALAHPERHAFFPDGSVGSVPQVRTKADQILYVCKKNSTKLIKRSFRGKEAEAQAAPAAQELPLPQHPGGRQQGPQRGDHPHHARASTRRSRAAASPEPDPTLRERLRRDRRRRPRLGRLRQDGGAPVANFEYQRKCPNAQNLIAIIGDSDDPDRVCDAKCNLQIQGMGRRRTDVLISGRADQAQRHPRRPRRRHLPAQLHGRVLRLQQHLRPRDQRLRDATDIESRYSREYGFLSFTSDHGLYDRLEAFGTGDSGVYPARVPRATASATASRSATSTPTTTRIGYSGTAGNGVWAHDNRSTTTRPA